MMSCLRDFLETGESMAFCRVAALINSCLCDQYVSSKADELAAGVTGRTFVRQVGRSDDIPYMGLVECCLDGQRKSDRTSGD